MYLFETIALLDKEAPWQIDYTIDSSLFSSLGQIFSGTKDVEKPGNLTLPCICPPRRLRILVVLTDLLSFQQLMAKLDMTLIAWPQSPCVFLFKKNIRVTAESGERDGLTPFIPVWVLIKLLFVSAVQSFNFP